MLSIIIYGQKKNINLQQPQKLQKMLVFIINKNLKTKNSFFFSIIYIIAIHHKRTTR